MAHSYLTTANVATFNKVDMDLLISDVLDEAPLLQVAAARPVMSNVFYYTRKTANPSVGFRAVNDGVENTKMTTEKVTVNLGFLDAGFCVDVAAAKTDERGLDHIMAIEAQAHLRQAMREVEEQIINGTVGNVASNAFSGFADMTNLNENDDAMVIDAGGTTAGTGSSVYLVRFGEGDVEVLWGQGGQFEVSPRYIVERAGSSTGVFSAYKHDISGWCGLKIGSTYSVARIGNLTADSGKGLTDDLISDALSLFPAARGPSYIVMNRRSLKQLQQSRTATNPTGAPAPFPSDSFGVPIVVTDAISSTETLLTT